MSKRTKGIKRGQERKTGRWRRAGRRPEKKINKLGKRLEEGTRRGRKETNA
jgi:hypothetical protein